MVESLAGSAVARREVQSAAKIDSGRAFQFGRRLGTPRQYRETSALYHLFVAFATALVTCTCVADVSILPTGDAKPALQSPYFPDRVHEFVWRNWGVVPAATMAT